MSEAGNWLHNGRQLPLGACLDLSKEAKPESVRGQFSPLRFLSARAMIDMPIGNFIFGKKNLSAEKIFPITLLKNLPGTSKSSTALPLFSILFLIRTATTTGKSKVL